MNYRVALIGIGGFGAVHARIIMELVEEGQLKLTAFTEIHAAAYPETYRRLIALGAQHYTDYEQMLAEHTETDFVAIVTPIVTHKSICIRVMSMGYHVLVEKPPAVTIQDLDEMLAVQQQSGKLCQVNFQNTSGRAFREMLSLLQQGEIGQLREVTGVGMWMRSKAYYARTAWAGKLIDNGQYVLDGTFNNPFAHLLNNCMLAAGAGEPSRMLPEWVQAELYRVNEIEGDDVSCIRTGVAGGVTVSFYAMLCHENNEHPYITVRGTEGEMRWSYDNTLSVRSTNREEKYSYEAESLIRCMYKNLMQAIEDDAIPLYSTIESCRSFVLVSNGAYESSLAVHPIPQQFVIEREAGNSSVRLLPGLSACMNEIAERRLLYSEVPLPWAASTKRVQMKDYRQFAMIW